MGTQMSTAQIPTQNYHPALLRQRKSVTHVQTQSLFGLGGPELAIILIAAAFLLGPQKLAELGKDACKIAGELKEVPKEFQKGLAGGRRRPWQIPRRFQPRWKMPLRTLQKIDTS